MRWWTTLEPNPSKTGPNRAQRRPRNASLRPPSARPTRLESLQKYQKFPHSIKNTLTFRYSANDRVFCFQSDEQLKAEKISIALQKLKEAKVRKVGSLSSPPPTAAAAVWGRDLSSSPSCS